MLDHRPALLLNADYTPMSYYPLSTLPWQTKVKLKCEDVIEIIAEDDEVIHSPSMEIKIPSVVAGVRFHPRTPIHSHRVDQVSTPDC